MEDEKYRMESLDEKVIKLVGTDGPSISDVVQVAKERYPGELETELELSVFRLIAKKQLTINGCGRLVIGG